MSGKEINTRRWTVTLSLELTISCARVASTFLRRKAFPHAFPSLDNKKLLRIWKSFKASWNVVWLVQSSNLNNRLPVVAFWCSQYVWKYCFNSVAAVLNLFEGGKVRIRTSACTVLHNAKLFTDTAYESTRLKLTARQDLKISLQRPWRFIWESQDLFVR